MKQTKLKKFKNVFDFVSAYNYANEAMRDADFSPVGQPDSPTDANPGSLEKIEVLSRRLCDGVDLWHPLDQGRFSPLE